MARSIRYLRLKFIFLFFMMIVFGISCMFRDLKKEVAEYEKSYGLVGKITGSSGKVPVIVVLYSEKNGGKELVEYTLSQDNGRFSFIVPEGVYYLSAFEDHNNNFAYEDKELAGTFGAPDRIIVSSGLLASEGSQAVKDLNINISADGLPNGFAVSLEGAVFQNQSFVKLGELTGLEDKLFNPENGTTGYWKPLTFLREYGIGIHFIEPYDPKKIPILFVHGATGTPRTWGAIVDQLDREKYQPWFFYYPSGLRLDRLGYALNNMVKTLQEEYRFNTLYVTAHSMGGLVARSFILKNAYTDKRDYIKLFVSFSTPWNGHRGTVKGVKQAPAAVPSWYDMIPDSEFIQSVFSKKLLPKMKSYLFFSFQGDCSFMMANNDGSVELSSVLDYRAQADAIKIFGYDEDHTNILASKEAIKEYNVILESMEGPDIH